MLKPKLKPCKTCGEPRYIFSHGNCKDCSTLLKMREKAKFKPLVQTSDGKEAKPFKIRQKPIAKISDKQSKINALYSAQRIVYLKHHPTCKAKLKDCTGSATDIHHKRGRGEYLLDETTWLPVCRPCHNWIEVNPKEAKELNLSESRLNKVL